MSTVIIQMMPTSKDRAEHYGIRFTSICTYKISGREVHNSGYQHRLDVWDNTVRPSEEYPVATHLERYKGKFVGPDGVRTDETTSYLFSAEASVLSSTPIQRPPRAEELKPGDYIVLLFPDNTVSDPFVVATKLLHDPHLRHV